MRHVHDIENCQPTNTSQTDVDEEDDVILIPGPKPPFINLVSDDESEETTSTNSQECESTESTTDSDDSDDTKNSDQKIIRCDSSSSSTDSTDDFIEITHSRNFGFETFGILSDDESHTVTENAPESVVISSDDDDAISPPSEHKDKLNATVEKPYEVDDGNSCMTDSVYAKEVTSRFKMVSELDSSSEEDVPIPKRQQKRKKILESDTVEDELKELSEQNNHVTTSSFLPDFMPLCPDKPGKYTPARSASHVSADSTTITNEMGDKTINLTLQQYKQLISDKGVHFLRNIQLQYNVSVRLEWGQLGMVLIVHGTASNQQDVHNALNDFFESTENPHHTALDAQMPKNRDALIEYVRSKVAILDSAMCNVEPMADMIQGLFDRIRRNEGKKSKVRESIRLRQHLNMVLFGRYGLDQGMYHLNAFQGCLRGITYGYNQNVPFDVRLRLSEHMNYIFSGDDHKNYEAMIDQMKRHHSLPPLILDRKLMGLELNTCPSYFDNTPQRGNFFNYPPPSFPNHTLNITNAYHRNNQLNTPPSLI
ncbi:uncharacterized protein LOC129579938 [Sitodiplosis mosellana]|uniref:uncharacterized protein LOC129579938 n=1 Tax=Sitodiplosis mosellana TaxID=263140 RepID=UPI002443E80A|nr:uncharacterized protein LOC129579938 [Sitodiplosis mosellana]